MLAPTLTAEAEATTRLRKLHERAQPRHGNGDARGGPPRKPHSVHVCQCLSNDDQSPQRCVASTITMLRAHTHTHTHSLSLLYLYEHTPRRFMLQLDPRDLTLAAPNAKTPSRVRASTVASLTRVYCRQQHSVRDCTSSCCGFPTAHGMNRCFSMRVLLLSIIPARTTASTRQHRDRHITSSPVHTWAAYPTTLVVPAQHQRHCCDGMACRVQAHTHTHTHTHAAANARSGCLDVHGSLAEYTRTAQRSTA